MIHLLKLSVRMRALTIDWTNWRGNPPSICCRIRGLNHTNTCQNLMMLQVKKNIFLAKFQCSFGFQNFSNKCRVIFRIFKVRRFEESFCYVLKKTRLRSVGFAVWFSIICLVVGNSVFCAHSGKAMLTFQKLWWKTCAAFVCTTENLRHILQHEMF